MRDFRKDYSKYKIVTKLSIISVTTLLMMFAGTASIDSQNHSVYAASKNATSSSSSSTSKGGGSSTKNSTSPVGSSTFLNVITKVDNSKGGTSKPSDFTISVSGKSPSPKSFSGSSSGTSVTLKAGKYKVTGSGPSSYTTKYSSGCSGTASGGAPIKCTISASYSSPTPPSPSPSPTPTPKNVSSPDRGFYYVTIKAFIKRSDCRSTACPEVDSHTIKLEWWFIAQDGRKILERPEYWRPNNVGNTWSTFLGYVDQPAFPTGYRISAYCEGLNIRGTCDNVGGATPYGHFSYQHAYINGGTGQCSSYNPGKDDPFGHTACDSASTTTAGHSTVNVYFYWKCSSFIGC
jgi:hypothetical protein